MRMGSFVAVCSALLVGGLGPVACNIETPTPNLAGQDVSVTVVHTADTHSRYFPYFFAPGAIDKGLGLLPQNGKDTAVVGGIARVSTVAQCIRGRMTGPLCDQIADKTGPAAVRSLHVDSGDIFEGAPVFNVFAGEVETRAMTQLGLSVMVIGNHEFDKGSVNAFTQFQRFAGFTILAANYDFGDPTNPLNTKFGEIVPPYYITNLGGIKVGVIGMANLSSIQGIIEGGNSLGVRPLEEKSALAAVAAVLRPQVDLLLVVSHLGLDEDEDVSAADAESRDQNQAIAIDGVDVIFGGHLHIVLNPPKQLQRIDGLTGIETGSTVLCHSGAFAKYVGRLDLVVHVPTEEEKKAGTHGSVKSYAYTLVPIDDTIPDDPEMLNLLDPYAYKMNSYLNLTQAYAVIPCDATASACTKVLRTNPEGGDSQLGNLVAESMRVREDVSADISVTNSLGIRTDFESGALTLEQMYNVFPFENTITTMYLSGFEIQEMLDFVAARSSERGCNAQAQVAGVFFDMVCATDDKECNTRLGKPSACAKNIYTGDHCRLVDPNDPLGATNPAGDVNNPQCKPLNDNAEYRVAVNDYIANGGSGFSVLKRNTTKFNTGISLRDSLTDYIRGYEDSSNQKHTCLQGGSTHYNNVIGANCRNTLGEIEDCTADCCPPGTTSGTAVCEKTSTEFLACQNASPPRSPTLYDYSTITCLDDTVQPIDGRIRAITVGAQ